MDQGCATGCYEVRLSWVCLRYRCNTKAPGPVYGGLRGFYAGVGNPVVSSYLTTLIGPRPFQYTTGGSEVKRASMSSEPRFDPHWFGLPRKAYQGLLSLRPSRPMFLSSSHLLGRACCSRSALP